MSITSYEQYLALRAEFIEMLTTPAPPEPPILCGDCEGYPHPNLALVLYDGEAYCAPHALMERIGERAAEDFASC
jgi:hypothetical protein